MKTKEVAEVAPQTILGYVDAEPYRAFRFSVVSGRVCDIEFMTDNASWARTFASGKA